MPKKTKPAPAPPQKVWRIQDFFVAAAVRKGVTDLPEWLAAEDTERLVTQNKKDYRIDWYFDNKSRHASSFTIHHDGSWIYGKGPKLVHGKLQPPHAKGWVDKMITKGTPGEYARADWTYYYNLRNLK
jgi:hypothetical protein